MPGWIRWIIPSIRHQLSPAAPPTVLLYILLLLLRFQMIIIKRFIWGWRNFLALVKSNPRTVKKGRVSVPLWHFTISNRQGQGSFASTSLYPCKFPVSIRRDRFSARARLIDRIKKLKENGKMIDLDHGAHNQHWRIHDGLSFDFFLQWKLTLKRCVNLHSSPGLLLYYVKGKQSKSSIFKYRFSVIEWLVPGSGLNY